MTNAVKGHKGFVSRPLVERFWEKVDRRELDECWPWLGATNGAPYWYGQFWVDGRKRSAHAVSWELRNGNALPEGHEACHSCDNPRCVNPRHIFSAPHADNVRDAFAKGRMRNQNTGSTHCKHGHEFTAANTWTDKRGRRNCRTCFRRRDRERKARLRLAKLGGLGA